jgi:hypothetical protein
MKAKEESNKYDLCNFPQPFYILCLRRLQTPVSLFAKLIIIAIFKDVGSCRIDCYGNECSI